LALVSAALIQRVPDGVPTIARRPWPVDSTQADLVLPATGAALELRHAGWHVVLTPRKSIGALTIDRRAAEAFADTFEIAARVGEQA
jgi:hypothetical protein